HTEPLGRQKDLNPLRLRWLLLGMSVEMEPTPRSSAMQIKPFFDAATYTLTYVVYDPETRDALIIDPVLDYDPGASQTSTQSADEVSAFVQSERLRVRLVLETHA